MLRPLDYPRFADQHFLRQHVWPSVQQCVLQHDSMFSFMQGRPFPAGKLASPRDAVGFADISRVDIPAPGKADGDKLAWEVFDPAEPKVPLFGYASPVKGGVASVRLHRTLGEPLLAKRLHLRYSKVAGA